MAPLSAGSDYLATAGTLVFAPGETTKFIPVAVLGDTTFEPDEVFYVQLSSPVQAAIDVGQGKCTILNDDVLPTISIAGVQVKEGNSGTTDAVFTLTLSAPSSVPVTVAYGTEDGTAKAGSDYLTTNGIVTFAPGGGSGATGSGPAALPSLSLSRVGNQWQLAWSSPGRSIQSAGSR